VIQRIRVPGQLRHPKKKKKFHYKAGYGMLGSLHSSQQFRRFIIQASLGKKQDPISKSKKGQRHGSSDTVPVSQAGRPEFKP
jgi:hypothetical protein